MALEKSDISTGGQSERTRLDITPARKNSGGTRPFREWKDAWVPTD